MTDIREKIGGFDPALRDLFKTEETPLEETLAEVEETQGVKNVYMYSGAEVGRAGLGTGIFVPDAALPPVSAPVVPMTPELLEGMEMFSYDLERLDVAGVFQLGASARDPSAVAVDVAGFKKVVGALGTAPAAQTEQELKNWMNTAFQQGRTVFGTVSMPLESLLAAFLKLGITDPNNSPETQSRLADAMMNIIKGFNDAEKAANIEAEKQLQAAREKAQKADSCGAGMAIAMAVTAVVLTIATAGFAAPAGAALMAMAIAATVIAVCVGVGAGMAAAIAAGQGWDVGKTALQGAEYGALIGSFVAGFATGPLLAATAAGRAAIAGARAAGTVTTAATSGANTSFAGATATAGGTASTQTASVAARTAAVSPRFAGATASAVPGGVSGSSQSLMRAARIGLATTQAGLAAAQGGVSIEKARLQYEAAMAMVEANLKALIPKLFEMLAEAYQEALASTHQAVEQILEGKNALTAAMVAMLQANNKTMMTALNAPLQASR